MIIDLTQFWREPSSARFRGVEREGAVYGITFLPLAAGAVNVPGQFQVLTDAEFIMCGVSLCQTTTTQSAYVGTPLLMQLADSSRNKDLSPFPLEISSLGKTNAQQFWYWPWPVVLGRRAIFTARLTNPNAAQNVYLAFHGIKAFT